MTDLTTAVTLSTASYLEDGSPSSIAQALSTQSSIVASGLTVIRFASGQLNYVQKYVGEPNVPKDIKRLRRSSFELMRRMGTPIIVKHMWNDHDVHNGLAEQSPVFNKVFGQTRQHDHISHGSGFVSVAKSDDEWIAPNGDIVGTDPGGGAPFAPKYRGYGPGFLTWIIEPDATLDFYKHTPEGVFIRVQQAQAVAPWWPSITDNDLLVHAELDNLGSVLSTHERYQAKMGSPVSIRGTDRRGRTDPGSDLANRRVINQTFEMALLPTLSPLYDVEVDR